jgi:hypothetical protein
MSRTAPKNAFRSARCLPSGAVRVGTSQQILDETASQSQLSLARSKLDGCQAEHGIRVLKSGFRCPRQFSVDRLGR